MPELVASILPLFLIPPSGRLGAAQECPFLSAAPSLTAKRIPVTSDTVLILVVALRSTFTSPIYLIYRPLSRTSQIAVGYSSTIPARMPCDSRSFFPGQMSDYPQQQRRQLQTGVDEGRGYSTITCMQLGGICLFSSWARKY